MPVRRGAAASRSPPSRDRPECATSSPAPPASSARTSPRRSSREGHDVVGLDSFTDYYDPARKRENADGLDVARGGPPRRRPRRAPRRRRRRLPPRRPAGRPRELRRRLRALRRAERPRERRASSRRRRGAASRVVFASSSSVYGDAETLPDERGRRSRARSRPTASRSSASSTSPTRTRARLGLDAVGAPLLHRLRPAPAAGHGVHAACSRRSPRGRRSGSSATDPVAQLHVRRRRRRGDDRGDGDADGRGRSTTSAAARRRR